MPRRETEKVGGGLGKEAENHYWGFAAAKSDTVSDIRRGERCY